MLHKTKHSEVPLLRAHIHLLLLDSNTSVFLPSKWATRGCSETNRSRTVTPLRRHRSLYSMFPFISAIVIKIMEKWGGQVLSSARVFFSPINTTIILPWILQMMLLAFWWNTSDCMSGRPRTVLKWDVSVKSTGKSHVWLCRNTQSQWSQRYSVIFYVGFLSHKPWTERK